MEKVTTADPVAKRLQSWSAQLSYRITGLLVVLIISWPAIQAGAQCSPSGTAFQDGEYVSYEVIYNLGPIWIRAGRVDFKTELALSRGRPCWHVTSTGKTVASIEFLFKVRDTYQTWIDTASFQTLEFQRYIYENGYRLQNTSWFDYRNRLILSNTIRNDDPLVTDTLHMIGCTFDMLSSCFFIRSVELDTLTPGGTFPVNVAIDDSIYTIGVKFLGREVIGNANGQRYACLKFTAIMVAGTVFEENQEAFIWVTDDGNHIPVYLEAKIIVGSVKAYLKTAGGLKYSLPVTRQ